MELILVILKMASGYPPGHFPSREEHSKSEPHDHHIVMCMSKCCCLYLNSYCVYTSLYMRAPTFPCTYKNTCHFVITLHITVFEENFLQKQWYAVLWQSDRYFYRYTEKKGYSSFERTKNTQKHQLVTTVKTARNFQPWITKFMFLAKILIKYLTAKCSGVISSVSMKSKCNRDSFQLLISHNGPRSFCTL